MNASGDLERRLRSHFADAAPASEPERLFDAVMTGVRSERQRPRLLAAGMADAEHSPAPGLWPAVLLGLVAIVVAAALIGASLGAGLRLSDLRDPTPRPPGPPGVVAIGPGEPWILYDRQVDRGGGLFAIRPDGSDDHQMLSGVGGVLTEPDWSPDGKRIAFVDAAVGQVRIANIDGSGLTDIPCEGGRCSHPAWSPDGARLAFSQSVAGRDGVARMRIWIIDVSTLRVSLVVDQLLPVEPDSPRWSPDGSQLTLGTGLLLADGTDAGGAVAVVPAAGGELRYAAGFDTFARDPDWGRPGIVFSAEPHGPGVASTATRLFIVQPDGSGLRELSAPPSGGGLQRPTWTPDGAGLLAVDQRSGQVVSVDPSNGVVTVVGGQLADVARLRPTP